MAPTQCFDGIRSLDFGEEGRTNDILAMVSAEGERIGLSKNLKASWASFNAVGEGPAATEAATMHYRACIRKAQ